MLVECGFIGDLQCAVVGLLSSYPVHPSARQETNGVDIRFSNHLRPYRAEIDQAMSFCTLNRYRVGMNNRITMLNLEQRGTQFKAQFWQDQR